MDHAGAERKAPAMTTETDVSARQPYTGVLPSQRILEMVRTGEISTVLGNFDTDQIQPASIDLRLGDYAYPVDTSFLPGQEAGVDRVGVVAQAQIDARRLDLVGVEVAEYGRDLAGPHHLQDALRG